MVHYEKISDHRNRIFFKYICNQGVRIKKSWSSEINPSHNLNKFHHKDISHSPLSNEIKTSPYEVIQKIMIRYKNIKFQVCHLQFQQDQKVSLLILINDTSHFMHFIFCSIIIFNTTFLQHLETENLISPLRHSLCVPSSPQVSG